MCQAIPFELSIKNTVEALFSIKQLKKCLSARQIVAMTKDLRTFAEMEQQDDGCAMVFKP
jgi:hypothetical protein